MIEGDFYRTPQGRAFFADQITSIQRSVQETCNYDVMFNLLTCHNYEFTYDLRKANIGQRDLMNAMRKEVERFACLQINVDGFDFAIENAKKAMARYHVRPSAVIMPVEMEFYVSMVPPEKKRAYLAGEQGPSAFEAAPESMATGQYRGLKIYTAQPYDGGDNVDALQMLLRNSQIGEHYMMRAPPNVGANGLSPSYMDILIYNENTDQLDRISFRRALAFACAPIVSGAPAGITPDMLGLGANFAAADIDAFKRTPYGSSVVQKWTACIAGIARRHKAMVPGATVQEVIQATFLPVSSRYTGGLNIFNAKATYDQVMEAIRNFLHLFDVTNGKHFELLAGLVDLGMWLPLCITIARPFIEHRMYSAIVMVAGEDTGATLYGPADMQIAANVVDKTIIGHYTCHEKAVVTQPKNVCVVRDALCAQYVTGANTTFFGETGEPAPAIPADPAQANAMLTNMRTELRARLDMDDEYTNVYASMFAFMHDWNTLNDGLRNSMAFSIGNNIYPWEVGMVNSPTDNRNFPGGETLYQLYKSSLQLNYIQHGVNVNAAQNQDFLRSGPYNNCICIQGPHRVLDQDNNWHLVTGRGHFGEDAVPGDAAWRNGENVTMLQARARVTAGLSSVDVMRQPFVGGAF